MTAMPRPETTAPPAAKPETPAERLARQREAMGKVLETQRGVLAELAKR